MSSTSFFQSDRPIDWRRMAEPQLDQYDTEVARHLAETTTSAQRKQPYVRRPVDKAPAIFDGEVAVRGFEHKLLSAPRYVRAALNHRNLRLAESYVRRWPAAYRQFQRLIDTVAPLTDSTISAKQRSVYLGSSSHSDESEPGVIYATVDDALGLAQAMVHEMAHQKLRLLGISIEGTTRLISNPPEQLFESPIRRDRQRPMTAVFHAQYSFIYVTCLDLYMLEGESDPELRERQLMLLARNVPRMEAGMDEIVQNVQTDADGKLFVDAFLSWATDVISRGNRLLDAHGYGMPILSASAC